jgi:hypothetical protein
VSHWLDVPFPSVSLASMMSQVSSRPFYSIMLHVVLVAWSAVCARNLTTFVAHRS